MASTPLPARDALDIALLADHPGALPALQAWFEQAWPGWYGPDGPGDARADLAAYANRDGLPIGLVALHRGQPVGVVALKKESVGALAHLGPWVGAGFVAPERRRNGIATALLGALEAVAYRRGHRRLYCGTATATGILERNGWQFMQQAVENGMPVSIYAKGLQTSAAANIGGALLHSRCQD